ncbi:RB-associated KRAB zinc finger protein-like [Achroia grisella]|uniref:RB-associated KRAB zinc finger protein-like n=1 Tax=Achroia grisella TaxID=688607 RepID=UPI0027D32684|nr:RB-associated KRAB zinc finger protein-like [Achroia grisella]
MFRPSNNESTTDGEHHDNKNIIKETNNSNSQKELLQQQHMKIEYINNTDNDTEVGITNNIEQGIDTSKIKEENHEFAIGSCNSSNNDDIVNNICDIKIKQETEDNEMYEFIEPQDDGQEYQDTGSLYTVELRVKDEPIDIPVNDFNASNSDDERYRAKTYKCGSCDFESTYKQFRLHLDECPSRKSREKKIYKCNHCGFQAIHKKYKIHVENCDAVKLLKKPRVKRLYRCNQCTFAGTKMKYQEHIEEEHLGNPECEQITDYKLHHCSKCSNDYVSMKKYLVHLYKEHKLQRLMCVQCNKICDTYSTLKTHIGPHIKQMFVPVTVINKESFGKSERKFRCKTCKSNVSGVEKLFSHWESHLVIPGASTRNSDEEQ